MGIYFQNWSTDFLSFFTIILTSIYIYYQYIFGYWKRRGIPYVPPSFPFGNFGGIILQKIPVAELMQQVYNSTTEPIIGVYGVIRPILVIRDPNVVRQVLIKDFQYFVDRGVYMDEKHDPLSGHLFSLSGEKWKNLRVKLTPVFTSGKLKAMFSTLHDCGTTLVNYMNGIADVHGVTEMREISARYTTNIIASVAFGNDIDCIAKPNTSFRRYGRKALQLSIKNGFRSFVTLILPKLQLILKMKSVDDDVEDFILTLVRKTIEYREGHNVSRKDLLQLLIQLRNTGEVHMDGEWDTKVTHIEEHKQMTLNEIAAQAWIFYVAGFETSSSTMSFCLYELAKNVSIQKKVQNEIDEVTARHKGNTTYESISEMKYLEACIDETLRKYPPVPILNRECTKTYKIPGTEMIIEKGTAIIIPALALQQDEKYYTNPKQFDPTRFYSENTAGKSITDMPYLAFGEGPRICIGLRLGKLQTKVGLAALLHKFQFSLADNMKGELVMSPKTFLMQPVNGINLKVCRR